MNYQKHYDALTNRAKNRLLEGYCERHHIIPKCIGGTDDPENLVALTAEEHYVAHQLLVKIYPDQSKLVYAATMMTASAQAKKRNNKLYGWLRKKLSEQKKGKIPPGFIGLNSWNTGKTKETDERLMKLSQKFSGEGNSMFGKTLSPETRKKMSEKRKGRPSVMLGKKHSETTKKKLSEKTTGKNNPFYGKKHSEETKKKISHAKIGRNGVSWNTGKTKETDERLLMMSQRFSGKNNPMFGKTPWNKKHG